MKLARYRTASDAAARLGELHDDGALTPLGDGGATLSAVLHADDPAATAAGLARGERLAAGDFTLLAPVDRQEVWAAGVTYKRSQVARMSESMEKGTEAAASHYDRVYTAERPELFFKCAPQRVRAPGRTDPRAVRQRLDGAGAGVRAARHPRRHDRRLHRRRTT